MQPSTTIDPEKTWLVMRASSRERFRFPKKNSNAEQHITPPSKGIIGNRLKSSKFKFKMKTRTKNEFMVER